MDRAGILSVMSAAVYHNTFTGRTHLAVQYQSSADYAGLAAKLEGQDFPYIIDIAVGEKAGVMYITIFHGEGKETLTVHKGNYVLLSNTSDGLILPSVYTQDEFESIFERVRS